MPVVLPNTSRGSSTSNRLTSRTCHGSANSRIIVSSATAAERCPPPALKYTRSIDFIVSVIMRTENDRTLTSSSPSRDEDSFRKTAMSRREDIVSCFDVTIMDRSAHRALPSPYSKIFPAFRAGAAVTHAAGLGGKRFIDFLEPHACVSAFVQQHGSECAPARIEHRLGLS